MSSRSLIINAIAFQMAWFAALYGGVYNWLMLALLPAILAAIWHLFLRREQVKPEIGLFGGVLILGFLVESVFIALGTITYVGTPILDFGPPLWIMAMWLAFATLPHGCLNWLHGKWLLQIVLGGLSGPLSYLAGGKLGGATLHEPVLQSLTIIGAGWAIALPLIFWLAGRQNGS
jgi:hypothetical protein